MSRLTHWSGTAFNQVPDSDNRIHSDEVARAYGFTGALVPGVTVSAYLIHPAIVAWDMAWLENGYAHVTVKSPLYDSSMFDVDVIWSDSAYSAKLRSDNRLCAEATVSLTEQRQTPPVRRGDGLMVDGFQPPKATRDAMEQLQQQGCPAKAFLWSAEHEMAAYLREQSKMPDILRSDDDPAAGAYANMSFLLGCANRHFAAVARMSPWIHLETRSQNFRAVAAGSRLISEMTIMDLFNKKGHEFADCRFDLYDALTDQCVCTIEQRAIYRMR